MLVSKMMADIVMEITNSGFNPEMIESLTVDERKLIFVADLCKDVNFDDEVTTFVSPFRLNKEIEIIGRLRAGEDITYEFKNVKEVIDMANAPQMFYSWRVYSFWAENMLITINNGEVYHKNCGKTCSRTIFLRKESQSHFNHRTRTWFSFYGDLDLFDFRVSDKYDIFNIIELTSNDIKRYGLSYTDLDYFDDDARLEEYKVYKRRKYYEKHNYKWQETEPIREYKVSAEIKKAYAKYYALHKVNQCK